MKLFGRKLNMVLTLDGLDKISNLEICTSTDDCKVNDYAYGLSNYISFLNSKPKFIHFIPSFRGNPYVEEDVRFYFNLKYPNDRNRAIKETKRARLDSSNLVKFSGWKLLHKEKTEVQISNGGDVILFDSYNGLNPYQLYQGADIKSYLHLVDEMGLVLNYKTD